MKPPTDNEDFAWWIVEKLIDEGYIEKIDKGFSGYITDRDIKDAIRRILMENEKEEE